MVYTIENGLDRQVVPRAVRSSSLTLPALAGGFLLLALLSFNTSIGHGRSPSVVAAAAPHGAMLSLGGGSKGGSKNSGKSSSNSSNHGVQNMKPAAGAAAATGSGAVGSANGSSVSSGPSGAGGLNQTYTTSYLPKTGSAAVAAAPLNQTVAKAMTPITQQLTGTVPETVPSAQSVSAPRVNLATPVASVSTSSTKPLVSTSSPPSAGVTTPQVKADVTPIAAPPPAGAVKTPAVSAGVSPATVSTQPVQVSTPSATLKTTAGPISASASVPSISAGL